MHILDLTIAGIHQALVNKEITPLELVEEAIRRIEKDDHNAFEALMIDQAHALAKTLTEPEEDNLFWGVPFMIKDNFSTEGVET
ncbi:MAG: Asp-tRNA(Asn)/Glu-tRNA(Gln) amidotransferase subunit GatA, partial [Methanomicrobia archaeon]|nr:Asp-tRNA(Asn)/Glu-tRNA(Gln) amidotransferase subunit GatA [Methanomicrobia archaeon]